MNRRREFKERTELSARFWAKVTRGEPNDCWQWTGARTSPDNGYGLFYIGKKRYKAHRVAVALSGRRIPAALVVMHNCDNPRCCNPAHLRVSTQLDNAYDMIRKGRAAFQQPSWRAARGDKSSARTRPECLARGERHGQSKLTLDKVLWIRDSCATGTSHREVARQLGVNPTTIDNVVARRTWRHV